MKKINFKNICFKDEELNRYYVDNEKVNEVVVPIVNHILYYGDDFKKSESENEGKNEGGNELNGQQQQEEEEEEKSKSGLQLESVYFITHGYKKEFVSEAAFSGAPTRITLRRCENEANHQT